MTILVAGSSGLIGTALVGSLRAEGIEVRRLVRAPDADGGVVWDPVAGFLPTHAFDGVTAVVNLGGRSIGERRVSAAEKRRLVESRIIPTRLLAEAIARLPAPPALLTASAIGIYGDRGDEIVDESAPPGSGFLADLAAAWEGAAADAVAAGGRVVMLRTGIVLATAGGALGQLLAPLGPRWFSPYRWGLAGVVGRGRQYWSWISLDDEVRAIRHLLGSALAGPVNLVAPEAVTHRVFIKALGRAMHRPTVVPIPEFVVRILLGGELAEALVLEAQRVAPARLTADGFTWKDTDLEQALVTALSRR
ncbi:MAG: TIGR01777 family protein [Acidimicrobiia bacterium]|nr:TIGR01777 family protein [Acidimicrobiia bacterium]